MDWGSLVADETRILTRHYTAGRGGHSIDKVIVHHNDGNLSVEGCYEVWQSRAASAHYQVTSDGTVGQLVWDRDTAWHAGNWHANQTSIGIEHADCSRSPYRISEACLDSGAHLVAAVCRRYGLGRPEWGVNLFGHSDFAPTECPASLAVGGSQHDEYVARAQAWYDAMGAGIDTLEEDDMTQDEHDMLQAIYDVQHKYMGFQYTNSDTGDDTDMHGMIKTVYEIMKKYMGWQYKKEDDGDGVSDPVDMHQMMVDTWTGIPKLLAMEAAQTEAIKALAKMQGADPDAVAKAVSDAVEAKLRTIRLEVSTDAKEG